MEYISEYLSGYFRESTYKKELYIPNLREKNYEDKINIRVIEQTIYKILMDNPHPNAVKIFNIGNDFVEMENLNIKYMTVPNVYDLFQAKKYLQSKGIITINWSYSKIGTGSDGKFKVYDFTCAGIINPDYPDEWLLEPANTDIYFKALKEGYTTPISIDNYCFTKEFGI